MFRIKGARLWVLLVFAGGIAVGAFVILYTLVWPRDFPAQAQVIPTAAPTPTLPSDAVYAQVEALDQVMINLYQRVSPSVVHITSQTQTVDFFYGVEPSEGTGSGFVWDNQGHIVT